MLAAQSYLPGGKHTRILIFCSWQPLLEGDQNPEASSLPHGGHTGLSDWRKY